MAQDSDEELQEAPTKRPKLDCASRKFGVLQFVRANSRKAIVQTAKRTTMEYNKAHSSKKRLTFRYMTVFSCLLCNEIEYRHTSLIFTCVVAHFNARG